MSDKQIKLPDDDRLAMIEVRVREWAEWMDVTASFTVQHGSFDGMEFPEPIRHSGHELGATFSSPDGKAFIVCISDKCPDEKLDHVIVHELVHVHTFEQSGPDEREVMEVATDIAAQLVIDYRAATEQSKNEECQCPKHGNWIATDDVDRLTRELDVLLNGEEGAAPQASLCDIVAQVAQQKRTQQQSGDALFDVRQQGSVAGEYVSYTDSDAVWLRTLAETSDEADEQQNIALNREDKANLNRIADHVERISKQAKDEPSARPWFDIEQDVRNKLASVYDDQDSDYIRDLVYHTVKEVAQAFGISESREQAKGEEKQ